MDDFSWYTIEKDEKYVYLIFQNKKGVRRVENKRPISAIDELNEIKARKEERKARLGAVIRDAVEKAVRLAEEDPEEFKRRFMNHNSQKEAQDEHF